jgi:ATP phosphoribosyltransferase
MSIIIGPDFARDPGLPTRESYIETAALLEKFQATKTKIAIQKDGILTEISRSILMNSYNIAVPPTPQKSKLLVSVSEDGETGFMYARNKAICGLVANGAVNMAVVGTDRLIEDGAEDQVDIVTSFRDAYSWSLVLATPFGSPAQSPTDIRRVASQYPLITQRYFESVGQPDIEVIVSAGGTELYPYLEYGQQPVDAVVDLVSSGRTLVDHNLVAWTPSIGDVYPVLIQSRQS